MELQDTPTLDDPDQNDEDGHHEQNMNEPAHGITCYKSKQPENNEYGYNCH